MKGYQPHLVAAWVLLCLSVFVYFGKTELDRYQSLQRTRPYSSMAKRLNDHRSREFCDETLAQRRHTTALVVDKFREELKDLWNKRGSGGEPKFALIDLGVAKLRVSPKVALQKGFDASAWSWDEAYALIQRTQLDPGAKENAERWRDIDSMVKFLLEKDVGRQIYGKKFLAPDLTQHLFRPNPNVQRTGPMAFTVTLQIGDFRGHEQTLARLLENEWQGQGYTVKMKWGEGPELYRMEAHSTSSRSFVNHAKRNMVIANLAWTKTVAHELGHILGFDDHYYNVWNARNCYYSQESRLADIMSNSEKGGLTPRHWEILDEAYPWRKQGPNQPFFYTYGK